MLASLEKAGASDARALLSDPRMVEFVKKNPQYSGLISTEYDNPDRVNDLMLLIDRFRAKSGIAKPVTAKSAKSAPKDNSVLAGVSSARGGGSPAREAGDSGKSPDEIFQDEEQRLIEEEKAARKRFGL